MSSCTNRRDAVIRVYDKAGNVIETHEHKGDFTLQVRHIVTIESLTGESNES